LAGSDMVCFFLFANFPGVKAQAFIASNHSSYKANRLLKDVESILGIAAGNQRVSITTGNDQENSRILAPLLDRLPDNGMGKTISAYFEAYNTGDTTVMRQFFLEYALESPETPPMNIRIERYLEMFHNLGKMTFLGFRQSPEGGGWEVSVNTGPGDPATLTFFLDDDEQNRLRGIRVIAGN
ncbi:MAG TPA: hypothetical protein VI583_17250, partial [Cyclobacteriaceae bacterium]|nr:hypothetical protein [Cyclobacteriaceae bacterium]